MSPSAGRLSILSNLLDWLAIISMDVTARYYSQPTNGALFVDSQRRYGGRKLGSVTRQRVEI